MNWTGRSFSLWDAKLFEGCAQAMKYAKLYDVALRRRVKLSQLEEALQANDQTAAFALLEDPLLKHYPFQGDLGAQLKYRQEQWAHSEGMIGAMNAGDAAEFQKQFDANALIRDPESYQEVFPVMESWIRELILPLDVIGLRPVFGRASVIHEDGGSVAVRWNWMHPRFGNVCVLGIYGGNLLETDRPEDISLAFQQEITRGEWEKRGGFFSLDPLPAWGGMKVIVWGVVDTGFCRFFTPPLVLGTLEVQKKSWFSWKK